MMNRFKILVIISILTPMASAEIYQCNLNGKVVYSDKSCAIDAKIISIKSNENITPSEKPKTNKTHHQIPDAPSIKLVHPISGGKVIAKPAPDM